MSKTILIVDDEERLVSLVEAYLMQEGYRVLTASNGRQALEVTREEQPDLIVLDVMMPEMDGLEATRVIVDRWSQQERPSVVAMTANVMEGDREITAEAGMDDYVAKPIRVEELIGALSRVTPISEKGDV